MSAAPRVLQATAWYPPNNMGGTEMYVVGLVRGLRARGYDAAVLRPVDQTDADSPDAQDYVFDGAAVATYPVNADPAPGELSGERPHAGFATFERRLRDLRPSIYHQHSWSRGLGLHHLKAARAMGLKTVLTIHTPNVNCLRGTMLRFGRTPCEGRIDRACAACWSQQRGAPAPLARLLSQAPSGAAGMARRIAGGSRLATALSGADLADRRRREFDTLAENADRVVVVCEWLREACLINGLSPDRLVLSRQGVDDGLSGELSQRRPPHAGPLRVGFLGRWHPTKGVDVLIKAVRALPMSVELELVIHAVGLGPEEAAYERDMRALAKGEPRITIEPPAPRSDIAGVLSGFDALAIPSQWLETGPIVALEAQAAGLAILGSNTGGIAELVPTNGRNRLLPGADVAAWSRAIAEMAANIDAVRADRTASPVRSMSDAVNDMIGLYEALK